MLKIYSNIILITRINALSNFSSENCDICIIIQQTKQLLKILTLDKISLEILEDSIIHFLKNLIAVLIIVV